MALVVHVDDAMLLALDALDFLQASSFCSSVLPSGGGGGDLGMWAMAAGAFCGLGLV